MVSWRSQRRLASALMVLGLVCMAVGILLPRVLKSMLEAGVRDAVVWKNDSPPDVDARYRGDTLTNGTQHFLEVWLFNITNVDEIRNGSKPKLQEVGPFTYRKFKIKVHAWWDREGDVSVKEWDYFVPVPGLVGQPDPASAMVTTLNMALVGVVETIRATFTPTYAAWLEKMAVWLARWSDGHIDGLFMTRSAHELVWGYEDPFLVRLSNLLPRGSVRQTRIELLHNASSPEEVLREEPLVVYHTGEYNLTETWETVRYGGETQAVCWNGCVEHVRGTDGTQFHPGVAPDDTLPVWVPKLFRALDFVRGEEVEWLRTHFLRFSPDERQYDVDACHFQTLTGLMNITAPIATGMNGSAANASGPPVYVSRPHFCGCDASLSEGVDGLSCNESRHTTWLDVEPLTGITMRAHISQMISSEITPMARDFFEPKMAKTNNLSIILPIFWFEENAAGGEDAVRGFRDKVYPVLSLKRLVSRYVLAAGVSMCGVALVLFILQRMPAGDAADDESLLGGSSAGGTPRNRDAAYAAALAPSAAAPPALPAAQDVLGDMSEPLLPHSSTAAG